MLGKLRLITSKQEFDPRTIGEKAFACKSLSTWCITMEKYATIFRIINPKRIKLEEQNKLLVIYFVAIA